MVILLDVPTMTSITTQKKIRKRPRQFAKNIVIEKPDTEGITDTKNNLLEQGRLLSFLPRILITNKIKDNNFIN